MKILGKFPSTRLRRVRNSDWIRRLVSESNLSANDLILPIFLKEGKNKIEKIKSMPGINRYTVDKIPYILSLENPLVIYQFGFFSNMILHVDDNKWVNWKSLLSENFLKQQFQSYSKFGVVSAHGNELPNIKDKALLLDYTQKFGEQ